MQAPAGTSLRKTANTVGCNRHTCVMYLAKVGSNVPLDGRPQEEVHDARMSLFLFLLLQQRADELRQDRGASRDPMRTRGVTND